MGGGGMGVLEGLLGACGLGGDGGEVVGKCVTLVLGGPYVLAHGREEGDGLAAATFGSSKLFDGFPNRGRADGEVDCGDKLPPPVCP